MLGDMRERALAAPPTVEGLVDDERVDDRRGGEDRVDAMPERLVLEQREVIRRVVRDDRDSLIQEGAEGHHHGGDDLCRGRAVRARMGGRHTVDRRRAFGDLHSGIGEPVTRADHPARGIQHSDMGGDDAVGRHIDAGGLEIEHADDPGPLRAIEQLELLGLPVVHADHGMCGLRHRGRGAP